MASHKPAGHNAVSPFLLVSDARGMLAFLLATFDAQEVSRKARPDGSIMHAAVRVEDSVIMLGERPVPSRCSTHVYVPDVDACHARGLATGATSVSPPTDQPYGDRTGGLRDPEGNVWWIGTHLIG